jgi:hypothetical protein
VGENWGHTGSDCGHCETKEPGLWGWVSGRKSESGGDGQGVPIKGGNPLGERSLLRGPLGKAPHFVGECSRGIPKRDI